MAKNFVQTGDNITIAVTQDVKSGELVQSGDLVGIALTDAKSDDGTNWYTTIATKGVWYIDGLTGATAGKAVKKQPKNGSGEVYIGYATEASDESGTNVLLVPGVSIVSAAAAAAASFVEE